MIGDLQLETLRDRIQGIWGKSLVVLDCTGSTMDDAATAAQQGVPSGHLVVADQQTRGRGAHGRHWVSPPGQDLYFSLIVRPTVEPSSTPLITLAAGLGVRDAVARLLPNRSVEVKWPNDVWIGRRKCAGVLVETRTLGTQIESLIIGVGLNVNRTRWPVELADSATSLRMERDERAPFDRAEVLVHILSHMERSVGDLVRDGAPGVVSALRPHLALLGKRVRWEEGNGLFDGIDEDGAARVRTAAGLVSLHAARIEPFDG